MKKKGAVPWMILILIGGLLVVSSSSMKSVVGFSTFSLSSVNIESNDASLAGKQWVVGLIQDGSGSSLSGTFSPSQVQSKNPSGESPLYGFTFAMNLDKNQVQYPINAVNGEQVYTYNIYDIGAGYPSRQAALDNCVNNVGGGYDVVNPPAVYGDWICIQRFPLGTYGINGAQSYQFSAIATLTRADGNSNTATINNLDSTSVSLGDVATLRWVGNLVSGQSIPTPQQSDVCFLYVNTYGWRTISCQNYQTWKSLSVDLVSCVSRTYQAGTTTSNSCIQEVNDKARLAQESKQFVVFGGDVASTTGALGSGVVSLPLSKQFQFPSYVLRIKADYIGINTPVGQPDIVSASCPEFKTGGTGLIKVTVKNIGTGSGSFNVAATCQSPVTSNDRSTVNLAMNAQTDVYLTAQGQADSATASNCIITATDINQPSNKDTTLTSCIVSTIAECREGTHEASGKILRTCTDGKWVVTTTCDVGKIVDATTLQCVDDKLQGDNNASGNGLSFDLNGLFSGLGALGIWIVVVLVIIAIIVIKK